MAAPAAPRLILGCGGFRETKTDPSLLKKVIPDAIRAGYRNFDCAAKYDTEATIGAVLETVFQDPKMKGLSEAFFID